MAVEGSLHVLQHCVGVLASIVAGCWCMSGKPSVLMVASFKGYWVGYLHSRAVCPQMTYALVYGLCHHVPISDPCTVALNALLRRAQI